MKLKNLFLLSVGLFFVGQQSVLADPNKELLELKGVDQGKPLVKVGDTTIHQGYLDLVGEIFPRAKAQLQNPQAKKGIVNSIVDQEIVFQKALAMGLDKDPELKKKLAFHYRRLLGQKLLEEKFKAKAKEYYEKNKSTEFTRVDVYQIQINFPKAEKPAVKDKTEKSKPKPLKPTPPTAEQKKQTLAKINAIKKEIKNLEDFKKVAAEKSDDRRTKRRKGFMGKLSKNDPALKRLKLTELGDVAFKLKEGQVSEPIETEKGYHIMMVGSKPTTQSFEDVEKGLVMRLQRQLYQEVMDDLKKNVTIEYLDASLKPDPNAKKGPQKPGAPKKDMHKGHNH